ncbi:MAG TPA: hypothetical protein VFA18_16105, partial [Gemmataceae bacterium]|nr:hypothetical protein [Gemmataceae bacterium]
MRSWIRKLFCLLEGTLPQRRRGQARLIKERRVRPLVKELETRVVPSTWAHLPVYGAETAIASNGRTVETGKVPLYLIFAGTPSTKYGYDGSLTAPQITKAFQKILSSDYLSGLSQYGGAATQAYIAGTDYTTQCFNGYRVKPSDSYSIGSSYTGDPGYDSEQFYVTNQSTTDTLQISITFEYYDQGAPQTTPTP